MPALHVSWFDVKAKEMREVSLPARKLSILPALGGSRAAAPSAAATARRSDSTSGAIAPSAPSAASNSRAAAAAPSGASHAPLWLAISGGLAFAWVATLLAWWLSRRRVVPSAAPVARGQMRTPVGAVQARARFHEACRRNDAAAARRALLDWVAAAWPEESLPGLEALAKRIEDEALTPRLVELDRACYAGADWNGAGLLQALKDLPPRRARARGAGEGLAPLYP